MIDFYSVWPCFACTAVVLAAVSTPIFAILDRPLAAHPKAARIRSIDGLRGFLALAVVFHHIAIVHSVFAGNISPGVWEQPPTRFYAFIGPVGVSFFFMITGYLFWSRILNCHGRFDWIPLYIGRIFRIGPLYLITVGSASIVDLWLKTGYTGSLVGPISPLKQISSIVLLGLSVYPDVNKILVGVTWSIQYEWFFYASLPLLAILLYKRRLQVPLVGTMLACCLLVRMFHHNIPVGARSPPMLAALFLIGMLCACLQKRERKRVLPNWLSSTATVLLLSLVFCFEDAYTPIPLVLMGGTFYLITSGCSIFGLLTSRSATRLGDVSYGIYLLQGLILAAVFRPTVCRVFEWSSPWNYWCLSTAALLLLVLFATATFALIEKPGINLGRSVVAKFRSHLERRSKNNWA